MDHSELNQNLPELMKKIADLAKEDGEITIEEYEILQSLSFDVAEYMIALEDSMEDGKIDKFESEILINLKEKIISNARATAIKDGVVSQDEMVLLNKLIDILDDVK